MNKYAICLSLLSVIALILLVYIIPLGARPIIIPGEARYAEIPREMLVSGDWIVPRFNSLRYFEKPVMGYWLSAASMGIFGANAFSTRLPSALASVISALIIFLLLKGSGNRYREGFIAGLAFLTCAEVFAIGTTNTLDSLFSMFITAAMAAFFFGYRAENARVRMRWQAIGGVFAGLAFLTKGFIAFAIPAVVIIPFFFWERRWRELLGLYWLPLLVAGLVALPWGLAIYFREPDFWHYFFWVEHINRFMGSSPQHPEPFWFFLPVIGWGALPWTILLPTSIYGLVKNRVRDPLLLFSLFWFSLTLLFFSISEGKLVTYILPCYPPLMILLILGVFKYFAGGWKKIFNISALTLMGILLIGAVGLVMIQTVDLPIRRVFNRAETWKWIILVAAILIWSLFLLLAVRQKESLKKIILFCAGPVAILFTSHFIFPYMTGYGRAPEAFFRLHASGIKPDTIIVSDGYFGGSVCWFLRRTDIYLLENVSEFEYGLSYPEAQHRRIDLNRFTGVVENTARRKKILLILDTDRYSQYQPYIPEPLSFLTGDGFIIAEY